MATAPSSPTARRWELAARLRQLRTDAGKTIEEAAAELMCSTAKISRMETGGRGVLPRDVRDLCRFYGVPDATRDTLIQLATDSKKPGWWQNFSSLTERRATFLGLEAAADRELTIETRVIPGLLQTGDYRRELLSGLRPNDQRVEGELDELMALRAHRQKRFADENFEFSAVMDEAVIARDLGVPEVILEQIEHLLTVGERPNVTLRIVPFGSPAYSGIDGSFIYLGFDDLALSDIVHVEGMMGDFILDRSDTVARYVDAYTDTIERVSLSPVETINWLSERRDRLADDLRRSRRSKGR